MTSHPAGTRLRLAMIAAESGNPADGIRDYTERLMAELGGRQEVEATLHVVTPDRLRFDVEALGRMDAVLVQYNPFWYGRRGFAPALPALLWRLRRSGRRPVIAAMVHETFVDMKNLRWALMGGWQRAQLEAIRAACDLVLCSIERWTERLRGSWPHRPVVHLPVASNLPDMRGERSAARRELGAGDDVLVLACFGLDHPGRLRGHVLAGGRAVAATRPTMIVNLGESGRVHEPPSGGEARLLAPGFQEPAALARLLAAADVFLAPYADGVSTRRTTVMAALQHGIPVVGTRGHLTDRRMLRAADALTLLPVEDVDGFAQSVARLGGDPGALAARGAAGRRLYETEFDWPILTARLTAHLERACSAR